MINERIWDWFDSGYISEAVIGENEFFIPDITYRENHDSILVIRQLILWAANNNKEVYAANAIVKLLYSLIKQNYISKLVDILITYFIVTKSDGKILPIDFNNILEPISELVNNMSRQISMNNNLRNSLIQLTNYWPDLKVKLGL